MKALLIVMLASGVATAHPVVIVGDPDLVLDAPYRPPVLQVTPAEKVHTRLGLRTGAGKMPLGPFDVTSVGLLQLSGDLEIAEHARTFAEYEFLLLSAEVPGIEDPLEGVGHRGSIGLLRELAVKRTSDHVAKFDVSAELGGGAMLATGAVARRVIPHGLVGLRFGFSLHLSHDAEREPSFGFELLVRAIVVPEGAGLTLGIGLMWGE